jgi:hypothetical protein
VRTGIAGLGSRFSTRGRIQAHVVRPIRLSISIFWITACLCFIHVMIDKELPGMWGVFGSYSVTFVDGQQWRRIRSKDNSQLGDTFSVIIRRIAAGFNQENGVATCSKVGSVNQLISFHVNIASRYPGHSRERASTRTRADNNVVIFRNWGRRCDCNRCYGSYNSSNHDVACRKQICAANEECETTAGRDKMQEVPGN